MNPDTNGSRYGRRLAAALAGLAILLAGCGGGDESTMGGAGDVAPAAPEAAPQPAAEADRSVARDGAAEPGRPEPGQAETVKITREERSIIYVADMTVRVKDITTAADKAKQIVNGAGGHLAAEESSSYGQENGSATLTFKIPPSAYPGVLDRLSKELGTRESLRQSTEDVTEQVADVESRLASARSALESLRALLKKANTIGEVLEVEREIANREAELESLQARQKALAAQTSMATLTLRLIGPLAPVPEPEEPGGFLDGLEAGWEALVATVRVALVVLGALLPWLLVIVPPVWLAIALMRRRARRGARLRPDPVPLAASEPAGTAPQKPAEGSSPPSSPSN